MLSPIIIIYINRTDATICTYTFVWHIHSDFSPVQNEKLKKKKRKKKEKKTDEPTHIQGDAIQFSPGERQTSNMHKTNACDDLTSVTEWNINWAERERER